MGARATSNKEDEDEVFIGKSMLERMTVEEALEQMGWSREELSKVISMEALSTLFDDRDTPATIVFTFEGKEVTISQTESAVEPIPDDDPFFAADSFSSGKPTTEDDIDEVVYGDNEN